MTFIATRRLRSRSNARERSDIDDHELGEHGDSIRTLHYVQVGQDYTLVDNDDAGTYASLAFFFATLVVAITDHAHHRWQYCFICLDCGRRQHIVFQRVQYGCINVFLGYLLLCGTHGGKQSDQQHHG